MATLGMSLLRISGKLTNYSTLHAFTYLVHMDGQSYKDLIDYEGDKQTTMEGHPPKTNQKIPNKLQGTIQS